MDQLRSVSQVLVDEKAALNESLTNTPLALGNLANAYNGASGTLDIRADLNELNQPPVVALCKQLRAGELPGGQDGNLPASLSDACQRLQPVLDGVAPLPTPGEALGAIQQGKLPQLPLPLGGANGVETPLGGGGQQ